MNTTHDPAFLKRRKFLMVLPLLVLPFVTMGFWALGGGSKTTVTAVQSSRGLNMMLPDAELKVKDGPDKMSLYDQAQRDSAKLVRSGVYTESSSLVLTGEGRSFKTDPAELAISNRLAQINAQANAPAVVPSVSTVSPGAAADPSLTGDVDRLEKLMQNMKESSGAEDPEMQQLNSMMDKILAIQNPALVTPAVTVLPVSDSLFRTIPALVVGPVKVTQGSVIELRLQDSVTINGQLLLKGHSVFGIAEFSNQRIALEIRNIRLGTSIIPVSLSIYDKRDGMRGINAPEALLAEAVGSASVGVMGSVGLMGFDQNLGTQVAGAGLNAAKGLLSKKINRVKQKLAAGYPVLLRDNSRKLKK